VPVNAGVRPELAAVASCITNHVVPVEMREMKNLRTFFRFNAIGQVIGIELHGVKARNPLVNPKSLHFEVA
jgi:hypothetical protein